MAASNGNTRPRHVPTGITHIYKSQRADERWSYEVRFTTPSGKRVYETVGAGKGALAKAKGRAAELHAPNALVVESANVTLAQVIEAWEADRAPHLKPRTRQTYETVIRNRIKNTPLERMRVREIRALTISRWLNGMKRLDGKDGDVSGGSKSLALATLAVLLRHAVRMEALSAVPTLAREDKPRKGDSGRKQRRILSREEEAQIFEALDLDTCSWALPIAQVALAQALRLGESVALDWSDVNFTEGTLTVTRTLAKDGRSTGTPKGGQAATITLTERARKVLLEAWMAEGCAAEGLVFPNAYGEHRTGQATARAFMRAVEKAGLTGSGVSFHSLRHTAVSRLANDPRIPLIAVRDFARHSSLMVTEDYMHPVADTQVADAIKVAI